MPWMAVSSFFGSLAACYFDQAFQLGKRPHLRIWIAALAAATAIALSFYLIPAHGPIGAAIAVTAASIVSCVCSMVTGRYAYPIPWPVTGGVRVGFCCALMTLAVIVLPENGWTGLLLRVGFGAIAYLAAALAVNLLDSRNHFWRIAKELATRLAAFRGAAASK